MQIVIDISSEDYDDIRLTGENTINLGVLLALRQAVRNCIRLPEGHGRLIDADRIKDNYKRKQALFLEVYGTPMEMTKDMRSRWYELETAITDITKAPTILEADTESER